jgi:hypothetical protein
MLETKVNIYNKLSEEQTIAELDKAALYYQHYSPLT